MRSRITPAVFVYVRGAFLLERACRSITFTETIFISSYFFIAELKQIAPSEYNSDGQGRCVTWDDIVGALKNSSVVSSVTTDHSAVETGPMLFRDPITLLSSGTLPRE